VRLLAASRRGAGGRTMHFECNRVT
jgi:hypothetical protein